MLLFTSGTYAVNTWLPEVPPPGAGVVTVMFAFPGRRIWLAGTVAVSCVDDEYVVVNAVPFTDTTELVVKPDP